MKKENTSRRSFVKQTFYFSSLLIGIGAVLKACGNPTEKQTEGNLTAVSQKGVGNGDPCQDFSGVSEAELAKRQKFGYVEETSLPESKCKNCQLWIMPAEGQNCGGCMLFKGPVYSDAYCTYWAPQV